MPSAPTLLSAPQDGDTASGRGSTETGLNGTLTPASAMSSIHSRRNSIGQLADMAESTGDIAEREADELSSLGSLDTDNQLATNHKDARDTYPPLTDAAGKEAAARERARINAYRAGGIRFAPWNIPYRRRLQTMAVLAHCLSIAMTVSFFFFLCAIPLTWPILIPYLLHMLLSKSATDGRLRARSERFRRLPIWKFFADYFPATLHKTHDLPPTRKYIFGYHPHGIISHGAFAAFGTEALGFADKFPGITNSLLTLDSNFRIPLYRDYILALGIQSVSKESITSILTTGGRDGDGMGRAVTIVVGGARESLEAHPGTMRLVLAQRKGFVKMAMRTGADLVPVLAFGENDLYDQLSARHHPLLHRLQMWVLRTLKFTLPFLHGRGIFNYDVGLMPYRRPLNIVVGRPIPVRKVPTGEKMDARELDRLHREYVGELERMWERYRGVFVKGSGVKTAAGEKGGLRILD
ncbi:diacylglycerol acyltransferase-domain-containing protein [Chaetomium fimeti]|uniref:Diacylglycerol O-acyltransferase n=1 Tax=Chaetomium fimeti TaxID=1854472 RepID=A0AAE0LVF3_9PEZI|nr:diacylglycerol acyltransferase-domain-containing protein [Chaetomium fimeti]